jgi:phosphoribosyl-AMP cyclohydrolase
MSTEELLSVDQVAFDERGLVPVIAQDVDTGEVLMLAWANRDSLALTLSEGRMVYWSRSRAELWRKGETSGHIQHLDELRVDCDADVVLARVHQVGAACHTGARTFFRALGERSGETPT